MGYKDPDKQRNYQRQRLRKRRQEAIEYLGGCCNKCGSAENLEFDHVKRESKSTNIARILSGSWKKLLVELDKCQLLCRDCHKLKTTGELTIDHPHGHYRKYQKGCRCEACKTSAVLRVQRWRATQ